MIAVKKGSPVTKPEDLAGKKVGVQLGTTGDIWISGQADSGEIAVEVARYDEITLAFQALANGDLDAIVNDAPTSADIIKANPEWGVSLVGSLSPTSSTASPSVTKERMSSRPSTRAWPR